MVFVPLSVSYVFLFSPPVRNLSSHELYAIQVILHSEAWTLSGITECWHCAVCWDFAPEGIQPITRSVQHNLSAHCYSECEKGLSQDLERSRIPATAFLLATEEWKVDTNRNLGAGTSTRVVAQ